MNANWIDCPVCSSKTRDRIREDIGYKFLEKDSSYCLSRLEHSTNNACKSTSVLLTGVLWYPLIPSRNTVQAVGHTLITREVLTTEASRICLCWRPCSRTE